MQEVNTDSQTSYCLDSRFDGSVNSLISHTLPTWVVSAVSTSNTNLNVMLL
jgi:hypothetical protein